TAGTETAPDRCESASVSDVTATAAAVAAAVAAATTSTTISNRAGGARARAGTATTIPVAAADGHGAVIAVTAGEEARKTNRRSPRTTFLCRLPGCSTSSTINTLFAPPVNCPAQAISD